MKNTILTFCMLLGLSTFLHGQHNRKETQERIDAYRVAFLTEHLQLTPEEAQRFWPVFNQFKAEGKALRKAFKKRKSIDAMTDAEAEMFLNNQLERAEKQLAFRRKYFVALKQVLPIKKIAKLVEAERGFKKKMLRKIQKEKREQGGR